MHSSKTWEKRWKQLWTGNGILQMFKLLAASVDADGQSFASDFLFHSSKTLLQEKVMCP